jgi:hypothetical protein
VSPRARAHASCTLAPWSNRGRRVDLVGCENHHDRAHLHSIVEIDHVLVGHANATRRYSPADVLWLIGPMNAEQSAALGGSAKLIENGTTMRAHE